MSLSYRLNTQPKMHQRCNVKKSLYMHTAKQHLTLICRAHDTAVLFDYVDLYSKYMCAQPDVTACAQQIIIPSISEQYQVVKTFMSISHQVHHLHDLEGVILKLIIAHDVETLNSLLSSLEEYNASIDLIKNIITYTQSIPMPTIQTPFSN